MVPSWLLGGENTAWFPLEEGKPGSQKYIHPLSLSVRIEGCNMHNAHGRYPNRIVFAFIGSWIQVSGPRAWHQFHVFLCFSPAG